MNTAYTVSKVWNFCAMLLYDSVGYGDYLEYWNSLDNHRGAELKRDS